MAFHMSCVCVRANVCIERAFQLLAKTRSKHSAELDAPGKHVMSSSVVVRKEHPRPFDVEEGP